MTTQRQPVDALTGLDRTRRSMGDGTLRGRARIATPYDPRRLKRPGAVVTPRFKAFIGGETVTLRAVDVEVPTGGTLVTFSQTLSRSGFGDLEMPAAEVPVTFQGYYDLHVSMNWKRGAAAPLGWRGGGSVRVRANGVAVYDSDVDLQMERSTGSRFRGVIPHRLAVPGVEFTLEVDHGDGATWTLEEVVLTVGLVDREEVGATPGGACWTNFAEYSDGQQLHLADWNETLVIGDRTVRWEATDDAGAEGGRIARFDQPSGSSEGIALTWDCPGIQRNGEALAKVRLSEAPYIVGPMLRVSDLGGYQARIFPSTNEFAIAKASPGSQEVIASTSVTLSAGSWYWVRFHVSGTTLSAKVWADGSSEPGGWMLETSDTQFTIGRAGFVGSTTPGDNVQRDIDVFAFSSTGTAPMEDPE